MKRKRKRRDENQLVDEEIRKMPLYEEGLSGDYAYVANRFQAGFRRRPAMRPKPDILRVEGRVNNLFIILEKAFTYQIQAASNRGRPAAQARWPRGQLEGWDFIQEKALSHDEDMISDYADDIDTLLVFVSHFVVVVQLAALC